MFTLCVENGNAASFRSASVKLCRICRLNGTGLKDMHACQIRSCTEKNQPRAVQHSTLHVEDTPVTRHSMASTGGRFVYFRVVLFKILEFRDRLHIYPLCVGSYTSLS